VTEILVGVQDADEYLMVETEKELTADDLRALIKEHGAEAVLKEFRHVDVIEQTANLRIPLRLGDQSFYITNWVVTVGSGAVVFVRHTETGTVDRTMPFVSYATMSTQDERDAYLRGLRQSMQEQHIPNGYAMWGVPCPHCEGTGHVYANEEEVEVLVAPTGYFMSEEMKL